eukprot:4684294-Prorocentrum_lima.AAC.1
MSPARDVTLKVTKTRGCWVDSGRAAAKLRSSFGVVGAGLINAATELLEVGRVLPPRPHTT